MDGKPIDPEAYVSVMFSDVKWQDKSLPTRFTKHVRCLYLVDSNGKFMPNVDIYTVLTSWLHDEFRQLPDHFRFQICI